MTPQDFYDLCAAHDWQYVWADDHAAWKLGEDQHSALEAILRREDDPALDGIMRDWQRFANAPRRVQRPVRPYVSPVSTFPGKVPAVIPGQLSLTTS